MMQEQLPVRVLVEPLIRGSRLQIVANFLAAMHGRARVILVTRSDYRSDHFVELVEAPGLSPEIVTVDSNLDGAWMRNLTHAEFGLFLNAIIQLDRDLLVKGLGYQLVFMALDDYLVAYLYGAIRIRTRLHAERVICLKYRVEYLFKINVLHRGRSVLLRVLTRAALLLSGAGLVTFDERMELGARDSAEYVLPDPWFGDFSGLHRDSGRRLLGVNENDFVLLTLGKQDRRKGFEFLLGVMPALMLQSRAVFVVVGRIESEFVEDFLILQKRYQKRIVHVNSFVPECDLPLYFAAADVFLLPYSSDFTATSGTLCRASASAVPVLATSHGLVGHRVRTNGLGDVFNANDHRGFLAAVDRLSSSGMRKLDAFKRQAADFSERMSMTRFEAAVRRVLEIN